MRTRPIDNPDVQVVFDSYPDVIREKLLHLRQLIFEVADKTDGVGTIEETLKWGQVSYLTHSPKTGTTIRIDAYQKETDKVAFFVHCQTSLVDTFQQMYPEVFDYEPKRAVIWDDLDDRQSDVLEHFIELTLTYHQRKRG